MYNNRERGAIFQKNPHPTYNTSFALSNALYVPLLTSESCLFGTLSPTFHVKKHYFSLSTEQILIIVFILGLN